MSERGCGSRVAGGVYLECKVGGFGPPIEDFILDPVRPIDVKALGIPSLGQVVEKGEGGRSVIYDRVGVKHYPDAADLVEEVLTLGVSRRVSKTSFPFENLGPGSMLALIHDRGAFADAADYGLLTGFLCPKKKHEAKAPYCLGSLYAMIRKAKDDKAFSDGRVDPEVWRAKLFASYFAFAGTDLSEFVSINPVVRTRPSLEYAAFGYLTTERPLTPAVVAAVPVTNVAVVNDPEDQDSVKRAVETAQRSGVPVEVVNE